MDSGPRWVAAQPRSTGGFDPAGFDPLGFDVGTPDTGGLVVSRNRDRPFDLAAGATTTLSSATPSILQGAARLPAAALGPPPAPMSDPSDAVLRDRDRPFDLAA